MCQLCYDLLHPSRARLGIRRDDDVIIAERKAVPDRRILMVVIDLAGLHRRDLGSGHVV